MAALPPRRRPERPLADRLARQDLERLTPLIRGFRGRRVAVLGDLVVDEFVHGDIARVSREAPVLVLEHRTTLVVPGGGGNAVANLRALGAEPVPVGVVGDDEAGRRLLASFEELGISCSGILVTDEFPTPTKSRIVAGGTHTRRQQVVRVDRGTRRRALPGELGLRLDRALTRALRRADGLLLADYGYGAATPERLRGLGRLARPVLVDSRARVGAYRGVTACTPNQEELELATGGASLDADRAVEAAGRLLLRRTGARAVLVTRGARGMCLVLREAPPVHISAFGSDEVADVTGAGDTVIATFTLALLAGAELADAARLANCAAGLVVMKAGTATVDSTEILSALTDAIGPEVPA